jgi:hypothetical protein
MYGHQKKVGRSDRMTLREEDNLIGINRHDNMNSTNCIYNVRKCNKKNVHMVKGDIKIL